MKITRRISIVTAASILLILFLSFIPILTNVYIKHLTIDYIRNHEDNGFFIGVNHREYDVEFDCDLIIQSMIEAVTGSMGSKDGIYIFNGILKPKYLLINIITGYFYSINVGATFKKHGNRCKLYHTTISPHNM